jgi:hypothetical protein
MWAFWSNLINELCVLHCLMLSVRCLTTLQLAAAMPSSTPFVSQHVLPPGQDVSLVTSQGLGTEAAPISAVLVMTDPGK